MTARNSGAGLVSYILSPDDRLTVFGGTAIGKFQQPNQLGLVPSYALNGRSTFDSALLDQNQRQDAWFAVLAYQHAGDRIDFQVAPFVRRAKAEFTPDPQGGNLLFNGVDTALNQTSLAFGVQADGSFKASDSHTLNRVFAVDSLGNQTSDVPIGIPVAERLVGRNYSAYLQDEWRLSDSLTFNYGVRFDKSEGLLSENQISPRAGLVWKPDTATTLHIGYARYFTPPPLTLIGKGTVAAFNGTTGAAAVQTADPVRSQREHMFDLGAQHLFGRHLTLGIDAYYKLATNLLDDTTLGGTLILSPFNYARSRNWGVEASASFAQGPVHAYLNIARGQQQAKTIISNQFLFDPKDISYIQNHYIFTDHSQKWTASGGTSLNLSDHFGRLQPSLDFIYGSGLRAADPAGIVPNGGTQQPYVQVNLGVAQVIGSEEHGLTVRFDVINLFDKSYLLHDGSGVGRGQPEYAARRGFFFGMRKSF
jgi:outer membrane receptor protein involved in Fe transport